MLDEEGVVFDDGGNVVGAMDVAHVVIEHGVSLAAGAILL
jgi:hypothetical protein